MSSQLFSPFRLADLELANRIVVSPMCQYAASDGSAGSWHRMHLPNLAQSGAGMVVVEATHVEPRGRITPGCLGLWSDANQQALAAVLADLRAHSGCAVAMQIAHAGRKGSSAPPWEGGQQLAPDQGGWITQGPSALPHGEGELPPEAMTEADLARVREAFAASARRALELGIDALELHLAHGYLLHQFLSPLANQRTDGYGGSSAARMRFPLEVFDAVRAVWPAGRPLGVRVSATDWVEGGWDLEQTIALARQLAGRGCDFVDVSTGGVSPRQKITLGPGYQLPFARAVRAACGLPTIGVGLITEAEQAEAAIAGGDADLVAVARAVLWNPRWPWHAAARLGAQIEASPRYWRSEPHGIGRVFKGARVGQR